VFDRVMNRLACASVSDLAIWTPRLICKSAHRSTCSAMSRGQSDRIGPQTV
jgi:hypothetical protein